MAKSNNKQTSKKVASKSSKILTDGRFGKKTFADVLGDLAIKPAWRPTLVPDADKRAALDIRDAATEFTAINENK